MLLNGHVAIEDVTTERARGIPCVDRGYEIVDVLPHCLGFGVSKQVRELPVRAEHPFRFVHHGNRDRSVLEQTLEMEPFALQFRKSFVYLCQVNNADRDVAVHAIVSGKDAPAKVNAQRSSLNCPMVFADFEPSLAPCDCTKRRDKVLIARFRKNLLKAPLKLFLGFSPVEPQGSFVYPDNSHEFCERLQLGEVLFIVALNIADAAFLKAVNGPLRIRVIFEPE